MAKTDTRDALLTTCIQDLFAGETLLAERLPGVAENARDAALRGELDGVVAAARERAALLAATGRQGGGPPNLWMAGILDDSERDVESIAHGPMLDTAMIGAVRKAVAANRVSYETAVALADEDLAARLEVARDGLVTTDGRLAGLLARIAAA